MVGSKEIEQEAIDRPNKPNDKKIPPSLSLLIMQIIMTHTHEEEEEENEIKTNKRYKLAQFPIKSVHL